MKNSLFDSLFFSQSCVYSPLSEKVSFMALYSGKIGVCGSSQMMRDLFHTNLNENIYIYIYIFLSHNFGALVAHAYIGRGLNVRARAHTRVCVCTLRVSYSFSFPKIILFSP